MRMMRSILLVCCALWLMMSCGEGKGDRLKQLEMLEEMNRADSVMNNDSLAEDLVDYFDKHGSPNEQMRARYILGRTYFDLGELPRALETYLKATDCADTTASDCDYKTLSRVYANMGVVYQNQIQLRSQLESFSKAESFARLAKDTLMAIESFSRKADAYNLLKKSDSVIIIVEDAAKQFLQIGNMTRYAQILSTAILPLLERNDLIKAKKYIDIIEKYSNFYDDSGNVSHSRKMYYYIKGKYYLSAGKTDSAEVEFRKLLSEGFTLNHLIAGNKGLQEVYERRSNIDSIAKYAKLGYELNDSAYSLSEMQNIQKLSVSYKYNSAKLQAEQDKLRAERLKNTLILVIVTMLIALWLVFRKYRELKRYALDYRLKKSPVVSKLRQMANASPPRLPDFEDWISLRELVEHAIPSFTKTIKREGLSISDFEYDLCLMTRVYILPLEMSKLKKCSPAYISNSRKRLFLKLTGKDGSGENFDEFVRSIVQ